MTSTLTGTKAEPKKSRGGGRHRRKEDLLATLARFALASPRTIIAVAILVMAAAAVFGLPAASSLSGGGFVDPASESVRGAEGLQAMVGLFRTFVELGGIFLQIDVVDAAILRDAQAHPDRYPNLSVRVSGWSARFATLNREWQELIISRMEGKEK